MKFIAITPKQCAQIRKGKKSNWLDNTSRATYNVRVARRGGRNRERRRKKKMRKGKKQVEGGRNIVLTWREERWNLSSYSFWSGEWCYVRLEEMHTAKQTTTILTEGRKIIWLENTHWHMLSSISVVLRQKLIPHETVVRRKAVLMAKIHLNSRYFTE